MCDKEANKHKETSSVYENKGKKKTSSTSENKVKARDGYVRMYECGKNLLIDVWTQVHSTGDYHH